MYDLFHFKEIPHVWQPSGWWLALFQIITCSLAVKGKVINQKRNTSVERSFHASWGSWTVRIGGATTVTIWSLSLWLWCHCSKSHPWPRPSLWALATQGWARHLLMWAQVHRHVTPYQFISHPTWLRTVTYKSGAPLSFLLSLSSTCSKIIFF